MDSMTTSAVSGLTQLQQLGLAGVFLSLLFIGGVVVIKWVKDELTICRETNKQISDSMTNALNNNTTALQGVQLGLARIEVKVGADHG